ncbi:serine protease [Trichoderma citrinoviride]|uniref:Serine protease n=1 Tax=Trichoderma citrinoviride TaxID=58853 RepID=A0A2T4BAB1_9HYPO|nr:serine protease [Trichoderma citrinoviride]PTB66171.1 serine protease [Trichoderma citrinoviride]
MRLSQDSGGRSELLLALHPAFVDALPAAGSGSSIQDNNCIALLRHEIAMMAIIFHSGLAEENLSADNFCACTDSLDSILDQFEGLVDASILTEATGGNRDHSEGDFPRLVALRDRILREQLHSASRYISFGKKALQRNTTMIATSFNQTLSKAFAGTHGKLGAPVLSDSEEGGEPDTAAIRQVEELSSNLEGLFEQLKRSICSKNPQGHNVHVRLSEFTDNELEMMISICGNQRLWQQVIFGIGHAHNGEVQERYMREICSELTRSYRVRKILSMDFNGKGFSRSSNTTKARSKGQTMLQTKSLREILQKEEELRQGRLSHYRTIKKKDKRRLGMLLSNSLIHYYGSPLLRSPWSANTIHIRQHKDVSPGQNPMSEAYLSCDFDFKPEELDIARDPVPGDPFVLALAALLIELELEREVTVLDEDIDQITGEKSLYMAVTRWHGDLDQYLEYMDPFPDIIDSCLQICTDLDEVDSENYHNRLRSEILTKVICPLNQRDRVLSKSWNCIRASITATLRDIPSYHSPISVDSSLSPIKGSYELSVPSEKITRDEGVSMQPLLHPPRSSLEMTEPVLLLSNGSISNSVHWLKEFDRINRSLESLRVAAQNVENVRVAVLDTGCDSDAPCIAGMPGAIGRLAAHWHDFQEASPEPIDEDMNQHGTALTALLLRVALHADIFVGRVAKHERGLFESTHNISMAIRYATIEWKADIITMSFGFPFKVREIENAIADANRRRRDAGRSEVIFFAAANNDGANSEELFPASHEAVISVRGTDHTGAFINKFSPKPRPQKAGGLLYGTLGQNVPYDIGDAGAQASGCSVATPIMASIVATIMQYVNYTGGLDEETRARLRTREGVVQLLEHISEKEDSGHRRYVAPWMFFRWNDMERMSAIVYALSKLERHM